MTSYAPVVLFVFSRPEHTKQTLDALSANALAEHTDLIIYSDAARNDREVESVNNVRSVARSAVGFRNVKVVEREKNYGLARNIIEGVSAVCGQYGRAIVLEDDILTSPYFLTFMNSALNRYQEEKKVWHVSGWNYPIDRTGLGDAYFLRVMNCWGWATWSDRWKFFERNSDKLISDFDNKKIKEFDLNHSGVFWSQVLANRAGKINTWAIFWYATIFKNQGLCLNPAVSYVDNIGLDGSGTHTTERDKVYSNVNLCNKSDPSFPVDIRESQIGIDKVISYYKLLKPSFFQKILRKSRSAFRRIISLSIFL